MDDRARALEELAATARRHRFTADEIAAAVAVAGDAGAAAERKRAVLVRVLAYLGGTFVFAGFGVFIALQWDGMSSAARVVVTLGSGLAAFALALLSSRDTRYEKATAPLFLIAAALEPMGMLVAFSEFGTGGDWRWASLVTGGTMALQFGAAFGSSGRSTALFVLIVFATLFWWTALDLLGLPGELSALVLGATMLLTAIGVDRTGRREVTPPWYFLGAAGFLYGLFDLVEGTPLELLFLAVAASLVYLSVVVRSRMLLFVATLGILSYTAWFTGQHFADSVGWPVALIAFGMVMIGLSALAFRIDRAYVSGPPR